MQGKKKVKPKGNKGEMRVKYRGNIGKKGKYRENKMKCSVNTRKSIGEMQGI